MVGSERKIHAIKIKIGTSHDEPGIAALRDGSRHLPKAGGALHRRPLPEDLRLVGYADGSLVTAGLVNVAFDNAQLDAQLGHSYHSGGFPVLTMVDTLGLEETSFGAILPVILGLAAETRFPGGKQILSILGIGSFPLPESLLTKMGYQIQNIQHDAHGAIHLTELPRFRFNKAQHILSLDQAQGLVPELTNRFSLDVRLPGALVPAKHAEREERSSPAHD